MGSQHQKKRIRPAPTPTVHWFALLAGAEAVARGILISVFPLAMYRALQDAAVVSQYYFVVGLVSLASGLMVPFITRFAARRWVYSVGALLFVIGSLLGAHGTAPAIIAGLFLNTISTVTTFICFNAYVLDYIAKSDLGRAESSRMFYSALGWTIGPVTGVSLLKWWEPAPFLVAAAASATMLGIFLYMRLGNGRLITKSRRQTINPLAFLPRFIQQPRLIAGWTFATIRSCGWWVYIVYLPIFAIENGLGDRIGGVALSISNATLFLTPFMLQWMQKRSIRHAVLTGFLVAGLLFCLATFGARYPGVTIVSLMVASFFLILLDISGGLPFLLAVKPSERTEMSAIYSSYRDISGILSPGAAWIVLLVAPISAIFATTGTALLGCWILAHRLHPRLGQARIRSVPEPDAPVADTGIGPLIDPVPDVVSKP